MCDLCKIVDRENPCRRTDIARRQLQIYRQGKTLSTTFRSTVRTDNNTTRRDLVTRFAVRLYRGGANPTMPANGQTERTTAPYGIPPNMRHVDRQAHPYFVRRARHPRRISFKLVKTTLLSASAPAAQPRRPPSPQPGRPRNTVSSGLLDRYARFQKFGSGNQKDLVALLEGYARFPKFGGPFSNSC